MEQWILLLGFSLLFLWKAPYATSREVFFKAKSKGGEPGFWLLTSSLAISWIFAKSIANAANLSMKFGVLGGISYGVYYLSFLVAGWVIYQMRTKGGHSGLHSFLEGKFGRGALYVFSLLVGFRLFNEVWSNTMVIGGYFGDPGTLGYFTAIGVFTALTLLYTLKGGMSSSMLTDGIQMAFFGIVLFLILGIVLPSGQGGIGEYLQSSEWTFSGGLNFLFVAAIQVFSYPFHDAVLTDRGFVSSPKTTLRAFVWAAAIGFACIVLFSLVGVHAMLEGMEGDATVAVSRSLGVGLMLLLNFIMVTSAASTLDSAFISGSKLFCIDLQQGEGGNSIVRGRQAMAVFAVLGTLPVFLNPAILSATTVSGTMVLGLAPVFLLWRSKAGALSFYSSVGISLGLGILYALGLWPDPLVFTSGPYADLLSVNIVGTISSFVLYGVFSRFR